MSLREARSEIFNLAGEKFVHGNKPHTTYSPIYIASTSNVKGTLKLYKNYSRVLTVGSTGAHGFEAALNSAKEVDMFDINELQRLYFELIKTAIEVFDYKDFMKYFTLKEAKVILSTLDIKDILSNEMYDRLSYFLPEDVVETFGPLFDYSFSTDIFKSNLFRTDFQMDRGYLRRFVSFYNEDQYYRLQEILRKGECKFNYQTVSLIDVPTYFKDREYDLVLLDNILQYYKNMKYLDTPYAVNEFIKKRLMDIVSSNGVIQINYGFEVAADAFKKANNMPVGSNGLFAMSAIDYEIKTGINCRLYSKWKDYEYDFIEGVEGRSENLVLTLRKDNIKRNKQ